MIRFNNILSECLRIVIDCSQLSNTCTLVFLQLLSNMATSRSHANDVKTQSVFLTHKDTIDQLI